MKKIIFLAGIIYSFGICYGNKSGSLTVSPGSDVSWSCVLEPFETATLTISIAPAPRGYRLTSTSPKVGITSSHPEFFIWGGGYSVVNSEGISATTRVKVSCVWEPIPGEGSGTGPSPPNLYGSATGTAVAQPGEYWNVATDLIIPIGGQTTVNAYKNQGEDAPSSWSVSGPADINGSGASATVIGTGASQNENDVIVTSTCNDCGQSDTEYLTVVAVIDIEAEPEIVCVDGEVSYKITTQPEGFNHMVSYTPADTSEPDVHEVIARCGSSSVTTTVTVVKVDVENYTVPTYDGEDSGILVCNVQPSGITPDSYQWLASWPTPAYNNPQGTFEQSAKQVTRINNAWWYATTTDPCTHHTAVYDVYCTVNINGITCSNSVPADFEVKVHWPEAGKCEQPDIQGFEYDAIETNGYWMVTGIVAWNRTDAQIHNYYSMDSQFYTKIQAHEQQHKDDFDNGFDGHVFMKQAEFEPMIMGMTNSTLAGLEAAVYAQYSDYKNSEVIEMNSLIPTPMEDRAYAVSDAIAPFYVYQSSCRGDL